MYRFWIDFRRCMWRASLSSSNDFRRKHLMTETPSLWPKSIRNANSIATGLEAPNISVDEKWRANVSPEVMNIKDEKTIENIHSEHITETITNLFRIDSHHASMCCITWIYMNPKDSDNLWTRQRIVAAATACHYLLGGEINCPYVLFTGGGCAEFSSTPHPSAATLRNIWKFVLFLKSSQIDDFQSWSTLSLHDSACLTLCWTCLLRKSCTSCALTSTLPKNIHRWEKLALYFIWNSTVCFVFSKKHLPFAAWSRAIHVPLQWCSQNDPGQDRQKLKVDLTAHAHQDHAKTASHTVNSYNLIINYYNLYMIYVCFETAQGWTREMCPGKGLQLPKCNLVTLLGLQENT